MEHITDYITDNGEAIDLLWALARKFDWRVAIFTEQDIHDMYGGDISDEQMKVIKATRSWRKIEDAMNTEGLSCIEDAIYESNNQQ